MIAAMVAKGARWHVASLVCALFAVSMGGCSTLSPCDATEQADVYDGGTVVDGVYMTSPWTGPLLLFPGARSYHLKHHLGCVPRQINIWASFNEQGVATGDSIAPSAGNMSIVTHVDEELIVIKNDTCSDFYILVTAGPACDPAILDADAEDGLP